MRRGHGANEEDEISMHWTATRVREAWRRILVEMGMKFEIGRQPCFGDVCPSELGMVAHGEGSCGRAKLEYTGTGDTHALATAHTPTTLSQPLCCPVVLHPTAVK